MKPLVKIFLSIILILSSGLTVSAGIGDFSYVPLRRRIRYAEEFYGLFRESIHRNTENLNANVFWLLHALKAPFAPPVQALAKIETPKQWRKYKNLFRFQVYYLITETYLRLGERYEKPNILFFNHKFKKEIKEGLQIAKIYYKRSQHYWKIAVNYAKICWKDRDLKLLSVYGETDKWQDRVYRTIIPHQEMNYPKQFKKRLQEVEHKLNMLEKGEYKK